MSGYSTGDNNQLLSDGTFDYEYDAEGNRTLKTNISTGDYTQYEWDHRNRLVGVTERDDQDVITHDVTYTYDVFNRRIENEIDADGAGGGSAEIVHYVYDEGAIILAFDGADDLTNRYLHGPAVDQVFADEDALGDILWPLADNLGSIRDITDSDGDVVNHITYDAFGNITAESASAVDHIFAYTGRERDEESDLQFNRARYYDPSTGRWISEDPIGFTAGDSNLLRYVSNSPTNFVDPAGQQQVGVIEIDPDDYYYSDLEITSQEYWIGEKRCQEPFPIDGSGRFE